MGRFGRMWVRGGLVCAAAAGGFSGAALGAMAAGAAREEAPPLQGVSSQAHETARRVLAGGDAQGRPFAIVDKKHARLLVYRGDGLLLGATPALLGQTPGDHAVPGAGLRAGKMAPHERTTPAGRFESEPGRNHRGEGIVWIDYEASLAIHRLRPAAAHERRPQRLASPTPEDNRISLGCVIVDPAFYDAIVAPTLGRQRGVVYVLPESAGGGVQLAAGRSAVPNGPGPSP